MLLIWHQRGYYVVFSNKHTEADQRDFTEDVNGKRIYAYIICTHFERVTDLPVPPAGKNNFANGLKDRLRNISDLDGATEAIQQQQAPIVGQPKRGLWARLFQQRKSAVEKPIEKEFTPPSSLVPPETSQTIPDPALASRYSRDLVNAHLYFGRLPGTRVEGERISRMLEVQPWLQETALEARLKTVRSPRILHIATHGFFLEDQKHDPNHELRSVPSRFG